MMPTGGKGPLFLNPGISMVTSMPMSTSHILNQQPIQTLGGIRSIVTSSYNVKQEPMQLSPDTRLPPNLYLCNSGNADNKMKMSKDSKEKATVTVLDTEYKSLIQTNIKDSLSSFVPDIPGEFDSSDTPESMLRTLIDRPPRGGREFLPLSEQSLLGFRLHPGPLPEQYRLDPPLSESHRHHKKKKKHKHKHVDKTEDSSLVNYIPPISREHSPPVDPCDFIKSEQTQNFFHQAPQHISHTSHTPHSHLISAYSAQTQHHPAAVLHSIPGGVVMAGGLIPNTGLFTSTPQSVIVEGGNKLTAFAMTSGNPTLLTTDAIRIPKPKKKRHENGEGPPKKKKKKDKDKKKKKHHNPDQPPPPPPPPPSTPSSSNPFLAGTL